MRKKKKKTGKGGETVSLYIHFSDQIFQKSKPTPRTVKGNRSFPETNELRPKREINIVAFVTPCVVLDSVLRFIFNL